MHSVQSLAEPTSHFSLDRDGFSGPVRLFTRDQCAFIVRHWNNVRNDVPAEWRKARAATDRVFFDLATRPSVLELLRPRLGENIVLWGASIVERGPGKAHPWHTDIESSGGDGFASVWVGLENTNRQSGLKFVTGSHRVGKPYQQAAHEHGAKRGQASDEDVLAWARELYPAATLEQPDVTDGDAILFDGRVWHGSYNPTDNRMRLALLLQYAAADQTILQPDFRQSEWPFHFKTKPVPVVIVSGSADESRQRAVSPAEPENLESRDRVRLVSKPLAAPLAESANGGWQRYPVLRGSTPSARYMSVHASVLSPGRLAHAPHTHVQEEILIVLDGEADILIGDSPDAARARVERVPAGALLYYPAYQFHSIRNSASKPLTYLMFKWYGPPAEIDGQASLGIHRFSDIQIAPSPKKSGRVKFFEQPTAYLKKLHAHLTVIEPGSSYAPHADQHDVAIVVLSGQVRAAGEILGPYGVFYFPAGELHGMENVGTEPARYLVFEFHSPAPDFHETTRSARAPGGKLFVPKRKGEPIKNRVVRTIKSGLRRLAAPLIRRIEYVVDRRLQELFEGDLNDLRRLRLAREQHLISNRGSPTIAEVAKQKRAAAVSEELTVVCYKWFDPQGRWNQHFVYGHEHVNRLGRMLSRHLPLPHRLVCVTDDPTGIDPEIATVPLDRELLAFGERYPKLSLFDPEMQRRIGGGKFLCLDLDCVIVGDLGPLIDPTLDFCIRAGTSVTHYNTSMILLGPGARQQVWAQFDRERSPQWASRHIGTDQAWISFVLGPGESTWTAARDGVLSYKRHCSGQSDLPSNARVVFFQGNVDPSLPELQERHPWIREHWR